MFYFFVEIEFHLLKRKKIPCKSGTEKIDSCSKGSLKWDYCLKNYEMRYQQRELTDLAKDFARDLNGFYKETKKIIIISDENYRSKVKLHQEDSDYKVFYKGVNEEEGNNLVSILKKMTSKDIEFKKGNIWKMNSVKKFSSF